MGVWQILPFWLGFTIRLHWVWVCVANNVWCLNCLMKQRCPDLHVLRDFYSLEKKRAVKWTIAYRQCNECATRTNRTYTTMHITYSRITFCRWTWHQECPILKEQENATRSLVKQARSTWILFNSLKWKRNKSDLQVGPAYSKYTRMEIGLHPKLSKKLYFDHCCGILHA